MNIPKDEFLRIGEVRIVRMKAVPLSSDAVERAVECECGTVKEINDMNATERLERKRMRAARAVFDLWLDGPEGRAWLMSDDSNSTRAVVNFEGGNCRGVVIESRATAA